MLISNNIEAELVLDVAQWTHGYEYEWKRSADPAPLQGSCDPLLGDSDETQHISRRLASGARLAPAKVHARTNLHPNSLYTPERNGSAHPALSCIFMLCIRAATTRHRKDRW